MTTDQGGIEEFELPKASVHRVSKRRLPDSIIIQKEAKAALVRSATVFISYLTSTANDIAKIGQRKTISSEDVLQAVSILEFDGFLSTLKERLGAYQESKDAKKDKKSKEDDQDEDLEDRNIIDNEIIDEFAIDNGPNSSEKDEKIDEDL